MTSKTIASAMIGTSYFLALAISGPAAAQDQRDQARANFEQADVNKDEQLDLSEFTTFINLNADLGLGRAPTIRRFSRYGQAFATLDANKDGVVSRPEIAAQAQQ
jgi:Ca2+-binding EF-hand superfamily protein